MPRRRDPDTEQRILNAAQTLWRKGGEGALTMRSVAKIAGTNTPTVYRRFKNRHDLMYALVQRVERELIGALEPSRSAEETCVRYVDFALNRPREYRLLEVHANERSKTPRQGHAHFRVWNSAAIGTLIGNQLALRLGGSLPGQQRLSLALWALAHGTATLLISDGISRKHAREIRDAFHAALDTLICPTILSRNDLWAK